MATKHPKSDSGGGRVNLDVDVKALPLAMTHKIVLQFDLESRRECNSDSAAYSEIDRQFLNLNQRDRK